MGKNICNYYIFTESGEKIGLGHLTRCIALYDELDERKMNPKLIIYGENLQPKLLQFKTNYWDINDAYKQAKYLKETIKYFDEIK
jgi:spore coat polysaccharide biosynthesis predicted glycosyltransferase SpsG